MTGIGQESTNRLLKVVIALLLRREEKSVQTLRQQIGILDDLGLRPAEISEIIGRTSNYVNKELAGIRKARKRIGED
jgi:hypothetical protein